MLSVIRQRWVDIFSISTVDEAFINTSLISGPFHNTSDSVFMNTIGYLSICQTIVSHHIIIIRQTIMPSRPLKNTP